MTKPTLSMKTEAVSSTVAMVLLEAVVVVEETVVVVLMDLIGMNRCLIRHRIRLLMLCMKCFVGLFYRIVCTLRLRR